MNAANDLVDIIKELIKEETDKLDKVVLCEIAVKKDEEHYDVYVIPDKETRIKNVVNMTKFDLSPGDRCYVYKIQNNFSNSFICYKVIPYTGT